MTACVFALLMTVNAGAKPVPKLHPAPAAPTTRVAMETSHGRIVIQLEAENAPLTVKNFLQYVDDKYYEGTIFHRVIADFMIQGGGLTNDMKEKPGRTPIKNESTNGLSNLRGTIAAARAQSPDSATSQFFFNTIDNKRLDRTDAPNGAGYCVFGRVVEGMDVIEEIGRVGTKTVGVHNDVPVQPVTILAVRRLP